MIHNPQHRIARLRRELNALNGELPMWDATRCTRNQVLYLVGPYISPAGATKPVLRAVFNRRFVSSPKYHSEERALRAAVKRARRMLERFKRAGLPVSLKTTVRRAFAKIAKMRQDVPLA
jgi:hypothetical protein